MGRGIQLVPVFSEVNLREGNYLGKQIWNLGDRFTEKLVLLRHWWGLVANMQGKGQDKLIVWTKTSDTASSNQDLPASFQSNPAEHIHQKYPPSFLCALTRTASASSWILNLHVICINAFRKDSHVMTENYIILHPDKGKGKLRKQSYENLEISLNGKS